jgi:hypothetical protein
MLPGFNEPHSIANTLGAANGSAVSVPGIRTGDVLLAIIRQKAGEAPAGVAVATFVVSDNAIQSSSVSTATYHLTVIWSQRN